MTVQNTSEDLVLIHQVAEQNQAALSMLYDRYAGIIYAIAYKMLGSVEEAEEVVLDVFDQVWRTAFKYDRSRSRVDSWLFMQARSRTLDRLRKRQRQAKVVEASTVNAPIESDTKMALPEEHALIQERRDLVQVAMAQIPPEQQQVIELAYFQGLSQSEIAKQTGLSLGTVKTRIRLGLSKLRGILDQP
ncbi:sigma-70 family RNA polymerase sigma factor [Acaryochloris sp. IP29b_bin.137]|uniref:sigma-70 family RNA polymerase sigma factor n=1 Tax=Acaryochloris sp. IP29b_bin.137 TaxID=2969217 RepID=UPI0026346770|nr:sigma-70 family RNA polymerase sigma factor [Acaryochloris sp. IP29b_bin.137]